MKIDSNSKQNTRLIKSRDYLSIIFQIEQNQTISSQSINFDLFVYHQRRQAHL